MCACAQQLSFINASHPAADPLLLASMMAYKIWDDCGADTTTRAAERLEDSSSSSNNNNGEGATCHMRDSYCMQAWQTLFWFAAGMTMAVLVGGLAVAAMPTRFNFTVSKGMVTENATEAFFSGASYGL
eukprot:COSAG02_NODE_122_length_35306_cov_98.280967_10_plen_129_part_00